MGDVIFQKKYTDSQFNRHVNRGEVNQYMQREHHEAIVSREDFQAANAMIALHRRDKNIETESTKYLKRYAFSGKLICGICGRPFKRRCQNGYTSWWCSGHIEDSKSCCMKYIREDAVERAFILMLNKLSYGCKQILIPYYAQFRINVDQGGDEGIESNSEELRSALAENKGKQDILVHLASLGIIDEIMLNRERLSLTAEARLIQRELMSSTHDTMRNNKALVATRALIRLFEKEPQFSEFDADLFANHVESIRVEARDRIVFVMKCGLELAEKLETIDGRSRGRCTDIKSTGGNRS